jgi:hypothetical protein
MRHVRKPAVAGLFYPASSAALMRTVDEYLARARSSGPVPKALIAPHAGYIYSGPVAASAYAQLAPVRQRIRRVVLLGPSHRVPLYGLALSSAEAFLTPLGMVPVDRAAAALLADLPQVQVLDAAHAAEHSLEVHLPFLQRVLDSFELVPLVVGEATPEEVAEVLERLWGAEETLIVVSTDLSHYLPYDSARAVDGDTSHLIEHSPPVPVRSEQACGCHPLNGLLLAAYEHGLHAKLLDLRSSGDTAGPRDSVVGYGAYALA